MTSLSKQRIVAGGLAVAYLVWVWRRIKKSKGANGIGAISETQLNAYLGSHDIKELVAEYTSKNKVECLVGDESGGRGFVLSRSRFIKLFNYCLTKRIPIAVWMGDHWLTRNGGEKLL